MTHIDVGPVVGRCDNFYTSEGEQPQTKSIVIAPIIITVKQEDNDRFYLIYACNLSGTCLFTKCLYSNVKHREK